MKEMSKFKEVAIVTGCMLWLPLAIIAFFLSPQPAYVKLSIGAVASFIGMLIFFAKMD